MLPARSRTWPIPFTKRRPSTSIGTYCDTDDSRSLVAPRLRMTTVAGVDFGTQSVRVSIVDSVRGAIGSGVVEYPVIRDKRDPDFATQSHDAHMRALVEAMRLGLKDASIAGDDVRALALDTTGSTVVPV